MERRDSDERGREHRDRIGHSDGDRLAMREYGKEPRGKQAIGAPRGIPGCGVLFPGWIGLNSV